MEEWKDIEGYEGIYQVSNHGRVKSLANDKGKKQKILKGSINSSGYYRVDLCKNNIKKNFKVYRLVAKAFIINPQDKPQVNHIDGNKFNNHVSNLEWNTAKENIQHAFKTGLSIAAKGERQGKSKLTEQQVREIRKSNLTKIELSIIYNVTPTNISAIKRNKTWKHI